MPVSGVTTVRVSFVDEPVELSDFFALLPPPQAASTVVAARTAAKTIVALRARGRRPNADAMGECERNKTCSLIGNRGSIKRPNQLTDECVVSSDELFTAAYICRLRPNN
jgi:hypothetical protein